MAKDSIDQVYDLDGLKVEFTAQLDEMEQRGLILEEAKPEILEMITRMEGVAKGWATAKSVQSLFP